MKLLANSCQEVPEDYLSPLTVAWERVFMQINNATAEEQTRTQQGRADCPSAQPAAEEGPGCPLAQPAAEERLRDLSSGMGTHCPFPEGTEMPNWKWTGTITIRIVSQTNMGWREEINFFCF